MISLVLAIQRRVSEIFAMDIHPKDRIRKEVFFDHTIGFAVRETATIANNLSILHDVTLDWGRIQFIF